jgi:predicted aldo/keto reductase-like oxidoreductase
LGETFLQKGFPQGKNMQYRKDPMSGNMLSVLGFGCMRFPRTALGIDLKKSEFLVNAAVAKGINYFDTAWMYPGSEEALGTILQRTNRRDKVYIATKLPVAVTKKASDLDKYLNDSLSRLKTDRIDYYLMHMLTSFSDWERLIALGILEKIAEWKSSGKIRQVGFSFHGTREEFLKILAAFNWDFCMIQYNYSDENYQAGITGLKAAAGKNIPVMIMEPLLGGRLVTGLPDKAKAVLKSADANRTAASWGIGWVMNHPEVTVVLSGMNSPEQLKDNLITAEKSRPNGFSERENTAIKKARAILAETNKILCTGCGYCMPCPKNVNIPGCFSAYNSSYSHGFFTGMKNYFMSNAVLSKAPHTASQCVSCHKCEHHCPQKLKIPDLLKKVSKRFEKPPVKLILKIVQKRK